jgi:hypothetical protein
MGVGRPPRLGADGLVYHPLNRGNDRAPVFFEPGDYQTVVHALVQTKARYPFRLYGSCLLTNHFHLVLEAGGGTEHQPDSAIVDGGAYLALPPEASLMAFRAEPLQSVSCGEVPSWLSISLRG